MSLICWQLLNTYVQPGVCWFIQSTIQSTFPLRLITEFQKYHTQHRSPAIASSTFFRKWLLYFFQFFRPKILVLSWPFYFWNTWLSSSPIHSSLKIKPASSHFSSPLQLALHLSQHYFRIIWSTFLLTESHSSNLFSTTAVRGTFLKLRPNISLVCTKVGNSFTSRRRDNILTTACKAFDSVHHSLSKGSFLTTHQGFPLSQSHGLLAIPPIH